MEPTLNAAEQAFSDTAEALSNDADEETVSHLGCSLDAATNQSFATNLFPDDFLRGRTL